VHARGRAALAVEGVTRHIFANELERVSDAVLYKAPWLSSQLEKTNRSKKQIKIFRLIFFFKNNSRVTEFIPALRTVLFVYPVPGFSRLLDVVVCAVPRLILAVNNKRAYFWGKKCTGCRSTRTILKTIYFSSEIVIYKVTATVALYMLLL
jgi:hypothetical protein